MRNVSIYSLEAEFAMKEQVREVYTYSDCTISVRYHFSHQYCRVEQTRKPLNTILIQDSESDIEFDKAVKAYIDGLTK